MDWKLQMDTETIRITENPLGKHPNDTNIETNNKHSLYEKNNNTNTILSSCKSKGNEVTLEEYLKNVELNIDNYTKTCKYYNNDSFYLEINATDQNNKVITYRIPLELKNNCPK